MDPHCTEESQQLGRVRAEYQFNPRRLLHSTVVGLVTRGLAVLCFLIAFDVLSLPGRAQVDPNFKKDLQVVFFGIGVFFTVFGALTFLHSYRNRRTGVRIYDDALVYQRGRRVTVVPWAEIEEVWETKALIDDAGVSACRLRLADGRKLAFTSEFLRQEDVEELQAVVQQRTFDTAWERSAMAYENGASVGFGPLRLSRDSLAWGSRQLWWSDVRDFRVDHARRTWTLVTHQDRGLTVPFNHLPNVAVFLTLLEGILDYQRELSAT